MLGIPTNSPFAPSTILKSSTTTPPKLMLAKPITLPWGAMGRTETSMGMGAASRFFSTRRATASSMVIPWFSASSAMGASKIRRCISASAASSTTGACPAACVFDISNSVLSR